MDDDDDLWRLKIGRFSDADERLYARLFRLRRPRSRTLSGRALSWRARHVDSGWRMNDGPQVVVKAAGSSKSRSGVRACICYIARLRAQDDAVVPVFDEMGRPVARDQVFGTLASWALDADSDNLAPAARHQPDVQLPERLRLRHVQSRHLVMSIRADDMAAGAAILRDAVAATIDGVFTRQGHRVLWAIHTDTPGRPHAHVVVKALSELGGRLRCDIHGDLFDTIRSELALNLTLAGLPHQAARCEDRADVRTAVLSGVKPLRRKRGRGDGDLLRRAPAWCAEYGAGLVAPSPSPPPLHQWLRYLVPRRKKSVQPFEGPEEYRLAFSLAQEIFCDPNAALVSWQRLTMEGSNRRANGSVHYPSRALALWYLKRRPDIFGDLLPGFSPSASVPLASALARVTLPPPEAQPVRAGVIDPTLAVAIARHLLERRMGRDRKRIAVSLSRLAALVLDRHGDARQAGRILDVADRVAVASLHHRATVPPPVAARALAPPLLRDVSMAKGHLQDRGTERPKDLTPAIPPSSRPPLAPATTPRPRPRYSGWER
jgi:hypothetical protein